MIATTHHRWIRLHHVNSGAAGKEWARAGFTGGPGDAWGWIVESVAHEHDCDEDDVGCAESDDGDLVTICGEPAYVIRHGLQN